MRKVLAAIARALRAMLGRFSAVMRRLLGLPDPGPEDVEEIEIPDVGAEAEAGLLDDDSYSHTLAMRLKKAASMMLRGEDYGDLFDDRERYERQWLGRLSPSQLERVVGMSDEALIGHVSGRAVVPGLLPVLRMEWRPETHIPAAAMDPDYDPSIKAGFVRAAKPKAKTTPSPTLRALNLDGREVEMIECGVEAVYREWREKMDREAAEADRDAA